MRNTNIEPDSGPQDARTRANYYNFRVGNDKRFLDREILFTSRAAPNIDASKQHRRTSKPIKRPRNKYLSVGEKTIIPAKMWSDKYAFEMFSRCNCLFIFFLEAFAPVRFPERPQSAWEIWIIDRPWWMHSSSLHFFNTRRYHGWSLYGKRATMRPSIFLGIVLTLSCTGGRAHSCPQDFQEAGGMCLHTIHLEEPLSFVQGRDLCLALSTSEWAVDLAIIKNYEEAEAFSKHLTETGPKNQAYLIGVEFVNGGWQWVDGSSINLRSTVWMPGKPEHHPSHEKEVLFAPVDPHHRYYFTSESGAHSVLCEAEAL
ncbi:uncharacterized protein LOC143017902 [Oratosquilla oratoria]|uniref:uncharacterized protein LOC143017902 n=1 Tax=Oratosquilla oratoria TaxID=337810 RepID=UPI003F764F1A